MPTYKANAYLVNQGKVIQTGSEVELTVDQAEKLGDKVEAAESTEGEENGVPEEYTEAVLKGLSAAEQKDIVNELGGNLEELSNEEKRIAFIMEDEEQE